MKRVAALALFSGLLLLNSGAAQFKQENPSAPAQPKPRRAQYAVKNADPIGLAEIVGYHFKGEATALAAPGGVILISGAPESVSEVVKVLEQLDRKPRTIEVEVAIVEVPAGKDGTEPSPAELLKDAAGKTAGHTQRIKLTAVEGQAVTSVTGGSKPYVSGTTGGFGKGGVAQKSVSYQNVGTTVKLTARVGSDAAIAVDLDLKDSRIKPPDAGDESGAVGFETANLTSKLNVPDGKAVVAQTVRIEGKAGATVSVVVVTARVVDPGTASSKNK